MAQQNKGNTMPHYNQLESFQINSKEIKCTLFAGRLDGLQCARPTQIKGLKWSSNRTETPDSVRFAFPLYHVAILRDRKSIIRV